MARQLNRVAAQMAAVAPTPLATKFMVRGRGSNANHNGSNGNGNSAGTGTNTGTGIGLMGLGGVGNTGGGGGDGVTTRDTSVVVDSSPPLHAHHISLPGTTTSPAS